MGFSDATLDRVVLDPMVERHGWDVAYEYGEPGYGGIARPERLVVLGNYWCRCGTPAELHTYDSHHPLAWQALEDSGIAFEWSDEWMVDYDSGKAYRTKADSYSWQPSVVRDWEYDDWLTPDTPIAEWIEWAANDPERCLLSNLHGPGDLYDQGFREWKGADHYGRGYESGWHPGQTDDPKQVLAEVKMYFEPHHVDVVFCITENSQFYTRWAAFYRLTERSGDG